jgi:DNA mismatch repair ATPase MutS
VDDAILKPGFVAGTQLVLAIERWRARHQGKFERWLFAWAEFKPLSALAGYAYEHPTDVFPDLISGRAHFEPLEMGHPLLSGHTCITNDIALDDSTRFYIVSGSNMAEKSTLLRAIGQNAVLATAGAPVRARQARVAVMSVCCSIAVGDSLREGASKFFAEVERLRSTIAKARQDEPVLFLVDEMLAGTNSQDRCIAAGWMLEALIAARAVGALSTDDLALTKIGQREDLRGTNVHMQSRSQDNPLDFDYRLRPGIASQTNGLAIVRMMGLQV